MRLKKVEIYGFRSIEEMEIAFDGNGHKILVGKNESGKSNILNALYLLSGKINFEGEDRKVEYNEDAFVRFHFELDCDEIEECRTKFVEKFPAGQEPNLTDEFTVEAFFEKYSKHLLYRVDCGQTGIWNNWRLNKDLRIEDGWYSVSPKVDGYELREKFPAGSYINERYIQNELHENDQEAIRNCLSPISLEDVYNFLRQQVREIAAPEDYTFPIRYWRYSAQEHDLPSAISKEAFSQDPNSCIPLKNMFLLTGIQENEIHSKISEANTLGPNRLISLLNNVNRKTNEYIKKSWQEYSNVKIELWPNGEDIVIAIQDSENRFDFKQRSDGFRRLVSFLLLISTEFDTKQYQDNPLILIDEPEMGLHPSSAKDLKYKLIELGKKPTIVYATHSISMIDTDNVERNLIVSKDKENTTYEEAKEDGTSAAENIYQAIGHSIYEDLKKNNILLEGYTDKRVFRLFMEGGVWEDFGICYLGKGKNLETISPLLDLASRNYFVLSDADEQGKRGKRERGDPLYWYTYEDLGSEAITVEDFYQKPFFKSIAQEILGQYGFQVESSVLSQKNNRIEGIRSWLNQHPKEVLEERATAYDLENAAHMVKEIIGNIKIRELYTCLPNCTVHKNNQPCLPLNKDRVDCKQYQYQFVEAGLRQPYCRTPGVLPLSNSLTSTKGPDHVSNPKRP